MFSIISVYHNKEILEKNLLKSLKDQSTNYELILVDNTRGRFKSATEALNYGVKQIKSDSKYIIFVHQDVDLSSNTWLEDVERMLDSIPNLGIAGVAGRKDEKGIMTIIKHGSPLKLAGEIYIDKPTKVQTLDECLVIIPKSIFEMLQFDEKTCNNWHLYGVDYCLSCKRLGFGVYAIPAFIYHRSGDLSKSLFNKNKIQIIKSLGPLPEPYYRTLKKVLNKHKNYFKWIYTTCGNWSTSYPLILQRIWPLAKAGMKYPFIKNFSNEKK